MARKISRQSKMSRNKYLEILGLSGNASTEEIDRAYKELIRVWHPDRFQNDPLLVSRAENKTRELNNAYAELKRRPFEPVVADYVSEIKQESKKHLPRLAQAFIALSICYILFVGIRSQLFRQGYNEATINQDDYFLLKGSIRQSKNTNKYREINQKKMTRLDQASLTTKPPPFKAAVDCNTNELLALLEQGHDIEEADSEGNTVLIWAVRQGCEETVKALISRGANVNKKSTNGITPLMWANLYKREQVQKDLIAAGSDAMPQYWDKSKK